MQYIITFTDETMKEVIINDTLNLGIHIWSDHFTVLDEGKSLFFKYSEVFSIKATN